MYLADKNMKSRNAHLNLKIIALDFYDGPTEGLILSMKGYGACYFKLIAWSEDQNDRLFVLSKIDDSKFNRLHELLARRQKQTTFPVWLPEWKFRNKTEEKEANGLVHACQLGIHSTRSLVRGNDISDSSSKVF